MGTDDGSAAGLLTTDPQGVGPPMPWFVRGAATTPFHFEFGVKGEYGAPRDLDGMVPQVYATWVNGLLPGRYYVRAWVFRYAQSALDGAIFQEYYFDVTPNEWAGDVTLPIDLRLSSWINKTVHYHITNGTIVDEPVDTGAGFLYGYFDKWQWCVVFLQCYGPRFQGQVRLLWSRRVPDPQAFLLRQRSGFRRHQRTGDRERSRRHPVLGHQRHVGWRELRNSDRHVHDARPY